MSARQYLQRFGSMAQFAIALAATVAFLFYLLKAPAKSEPEPRPVRPEDPVRVVGPLLIRIDPTSPLNDKLQVVPVLATRVTTPMLNVTGTVAASLRPSSFKRSEPELASVVGAPLATSRGHDTWQFNSPEILTTYMDWQRATADINFSHAQLVSARELAQVRLAAQQAQIRRLETYVAAGTDARKDLDIARADLIQVELQGRKDIREAEVALKKALRDEAAGARQLQQAGLDPAMLTSVTSDVDIVMADVPEGFSNRVMPGQRCEAVFFGVPNARFTGRVRSIAPVVSKDRRALRVLFFIDDLNDRLRPGMFAEIGMGTDAREALLVPTDSVIHVGRTDYLLTAGEAGEWRVTAVDVGEIHDDRIEVLRGLEPGDRVLGSGAILMKPVVAKSLPAPKTIGGSR